MTSRTTKSAPSPATFERQQIAAALVQRVPGAALSWKFGNASLVVDDKVFAFPSKNRNGLVLKLPAADIARLIEGGGARPLTMGKRTMREWVVLDDVDSPATLALLRGAMAYVESLPKTERRKAAPRKTRKAS